MNPTDWIPEIPAILALAGWFVLPGTLCLFLAGLRGVMLLALGPAAGLVIIAAGAVLLGELSVPWGPLPFGVIVAVLAGAAALLGRRLRRDGPVGYEEPYGRLERRTSWAAVAAVVAVGLLTTLPVVLTGGPELPVQRSDGMYHYNGAWLVLETGVSSSLDAMDFMYGLRVSPNIGYPAVWHALVTLVATQETVVPVTNALMLVLPFVWLSGVAALGRAALPGRPSAVVLAPVAASLFLIFPSHMLYGQGFWPNALGLSVLPGVLAALVMTWRMIQHRRADVRRGRLAVVLGMVLVGVAGMVAAHPSTLFGLAWATLPALAVLAIRAGRLAQRHLSRVVRRVVTAVTTIAIVAVGVVLVTNERVVGYLGGGSAAGVDLIGAWVAYLVTLWPPGGEDPMMAAYVLLALLALAGLLVAVRRPSLRWVAAAWVMQSLLTAAAYLPLGPLTSLTGLWYSSPLRIMAVTVPFAVLLVALGLDRACSWGVTEVRRRSHRGSGTATAAVQHRAALTGAAMLLVVAAVATWSTRTMTVLETREPGAVQVNAVAGAEEMALWHRAGERLGEDAVVLGDPASGAAYMQAVGQVPVAFAQVNRRDVDVDGNYLRDHFSSFATDPVVCDIVEHYGITHFYADGDGLYDEALRSKREPGLYGVNPTDGLTLVDSGGGAAIYRITACGPPEERDFFELTWRWDRTEPVADLP